MIFGKRENENTFLFLIRWAARILSLAVLVLLILFFFGESGGGPRLSGIEYIGFLFFPIGIAVGFIVGWKDEFLGGAISVLSLFGFYIIYCWMMTGTWPRGGAFLVFTTPGFLFLIYGVARDLFGHSLHRNRIA